MNASPAPHFDVSRWFADDQPVPLPVWPRELERQFYRWLPREPWPTTELVFAPDQQAQDALRPCLSPVLWTRFFLWRYQRGFGPVAYWTQLAKAVALVDRRLWDLRQTITTQDLVPTAPESVDAAMMWAYEPFFGVFVDLDITHPEHLFHRETVKKLRRLRLL